MATEAVQNLSSAICGKTVLITGVTPNSLGSVFVETISRHSPALVTLASRTQITMDASVAAISKVDAGVQTRIVVANLGSLASTRAGAFEIVDMQKKEGIMVDILVLNAGVMACNYGTTTGLRAPIRSLPP